MIRYTYRWYKKDESEYVSSSSLVLLQSRLVPIVLHDSALAQIHLHVSILVFIHTNCTLRVHSEPIKNPIIMKAISILVRTLVFFHAVFAAPALERRGDLDSYSYLYFVC
jgi:hypothetical protein